MITQLIEQRKEKTMSSKKSATDEPWFWQSPEFLKSVRERRGMSQEGLASESGITRSVIANFEAGRTLINPVEVALKLYRALAGISGLAVLKGGSALQEAHEARMEATKAILALLQIQRESGERAFAETNQKIKVAERQREEVKNWLTNIETEQKAREGDLKELARKRAKKSEDSNE